MQRERAAMPRILRHHTSSDTYVTMMIQPTPSIIMRIVLNVNIVLTKIERIPLVLTFWRNTDQEISQIEIQEPCAAQQD